MNPTAVGETGPAQGVRLLVADQVVTAATPGPKRGRALDDLRVYAPGAVAIAGARIAGVGAADELRRRWPGSPVERWAGHVLAPGFVDSHTHAVFGRWRLDEYEWRARGRTYGEIHAAGGGILASVRDLRARSEEELLALARPRLRRMLEHGTTTAEVKSGYGLTVEDELKILRVVRALAREGPLDLVPTFLGAHAVPPEYADRRAAYVELVVREMIPAVAEEGWAEFCDVFVEPGAFTVDEAERILEAAREHGLRPKVHADEFECSGGAELAARIGAVSADHLGAVSEAGIAALAASGTVATCLPGTLFFLGRTRYAPARRLIAAGAAVALATDFNPGTSPTANLQTVLSLAVQQMAMTPAEAFVAATVNGAAAIGRADGTGTLAAGAPADIVAFRASDFREVPYRYGENHCAAVWKRGTRVV